jgi:hypothetical protein
MVSQSTNEKIKPEPKVFFAARSLNALILMLILLGGLVPGCARLPGSQAMRQYQQESDRLLNEFRAQKKRAEELEARNAQLELRLAESEKLLALSQNGISGRNSRNRGDSELLIGEATGSRRTTNSLSESGSSRSSNARSSTARSGLPDAIPPTVGQLTSGSNRDPLSLGGPPRDLRGDRSRESQWRPIASPQR